MLHKLDKMMKQMSGPGSVMGHLNTLEDAVWAERVRNPQTPTACDGCLRPFKGFPPLVDEGVDEEEGHARSDAGDAFKHCDECDFTICKDCSEPENQGMFKIL